MTPPAACPQSIIGLRPFWVEETAASPTRIWSGYIADRNFKRDLQKSQIVGAARTTDPTLVDLNAVFQIRVIAFNDGKRPAETDLARLAWILGTTYLPVYDNGQVASYAGTAMDATDYRGRYSVDVLNDCAEASGRNYFAYWDSAAAAGEEISLYYHLLGFTTGFTSSIRLTNHAADIDGSVTFAATAELNRDPSRVYSGVWMPYDGGHIWKTRSSTAAAFISRHAVAPALTTKNRTKASNRADNFLDHADAEYDIIKATAELPKAYVNAAPIGRSIDVKFDHLPGYESGYTSIQITRRQVAQSKSNPDYYTVSYELANPKIQGGGGGTAPAVDPKPFVPDCVTGTGADTTTDLLSGLTLTTTGDRLWINPTNGNDGNPATETHIGNYVGGAHTGYLVADLGSATAVGGWGLSFDACCNSCPLYLEASSDDFASSVVAIDTTDGLTRPPAAST